MKIWKYSRYDSILLILSIIQFIIMLLLPAYWTKLSLAAKITSFFLLIFMITYNIIIISHLFTHTPWFVSPMLNSIVSIINSFNIGQSVQAYHLRHVRNHHRYNNDQKDINGKTKDSSSTFKDGKDNEHAKLFQYAFLGAASSIRNAIYELISVFRLFKVGSHEHEILGLLSRSTKQRAVETRQLQLDRMFYFLGICFFLFTSWQWSLICYLPAYYLALSLVNIQNYYEHYGAIPTVEAANSVSYYGKLYNALFFNDGYHQEHHLRPGAHWRTMPEKRYTYRKELDKIERIISPFPAIIGFLDRNRVLLHRNSEKKLISEETVYG